MDFSLGTDLLEFQHLVRGFVKREFDPGEGGRQQGSGFNRQGWDKCADFGIQALPITERYGGLGKDLLACVVAMEELGYGCRDGGLLFSLCCHIGTCALPIQLMGTDAQKNTYLPGMAAGYLIGGHPIADLGTPTEGARTPIRATRTGTGFSLRGTIRHAANASVANVFTVFAVTDGGPADDPGNPNAPRQGLTAFLVNRDEAGVHIGTPKPSMGLGGSLIAELSFDDCQVPETAVLGAVDGAQELLSARFRWQMVCLLACALGRMERQLDASLHFAGERHQFGRNIGEFQAVSHRLADMKMRVELSRLLLHKTAWMENRGQDSLMYAAIAKLFVGAGYVASSRDAIQIHGGYGYMTESGVERDLRDAMGSHAYAGASDVQRDIIAHLLGVGEPDAIPRI